MKEGQVSLFKADKTSDVQPDYTGKVMISGKIMRIALWEKTSDKGKFFSGKISDFPTGGENFKKRDPNPGTQDNQEPSDDLPF